MYSTKVFMSGNSQAVRIPKEYHIDSSEMFIKKIGTTIILYPQSRLWENLKKSFSEFTDDFMSEGRNQPNLETREEF
ncbi:MAG: antitoxin [Treponema sp.]|nr:antitoxin [Treponema sp.]